MMADFALTAHQRGAPRIPIEALCTEIAGDRVRHALAVDLSVDGLRIQRPVGGRLPRHIQLELDVPGIDEVMWAAGEIRFDQVWRVPPTTPGALAGMIRTTGVRLVAGAARHRRMLREYVMDSWRDATADVPSAWLMQASCYRHG